MFALIYASKDDVGFEQPDLLELCLKSTQRNKAMGITGYLYFRHGKFFQYLEGDQKDVLTLMDAIRKDTRHTIVSEVHDDTLNQRRFPSWSMRQIHPEGIVFEDAIAIQMSVLTRMGMDSFAKSKIWPSIEKLSQLRARL